MFLSRILQSEPFSFKKNQLFSISTQASTETYHILTTNTTIIMPKKKPHKVVNVAFAQFFKQNSTKRISDTLYSMVQRSIDEEEDDGVKNCLTSMVMDFSSPLTQPSPYRSVHPHLQGSSTESIQSNQDTSRSPRHKEGSKPTSEARYDDGCLDIPSVPVADVEVPSGLCDNISVIDSLSTFSAMDTRLACKSSDPKSKESSSANPTCAAPLSHCELTHTSQGNGAKDSTLEVSEPSITVVSKTSRLQVDSHDEPMAGSTTEEEASSRPPKKNLPSPATPVAHNSPPLKESNARSRRSIVTTNRGYVPDYNSIDVSIFDKSDDSTYLEHTDSNCKSPQGTKRRKRQRRPRSKNAKKTSSSSPSMSSSHPTNVPPSPDINDNPPVPPAKSTRSTSINSTSRFALKDQAKKQKRREKKKLSKVILRPFHIDPDRFNHIKQCAAKHLPSNKATDIDSDLFSSDEEEGNDVTSEVDPARLKWYGKHGLSKIACSLTPLQLCKFISHYMHYLLLSKY